MTALETRVRDLMRLGFLFGSAVLMAKVDLGIIDLAPQRRLPQWLASWRMVRHPIREHAA